MNLEHLERRVAELENTLICTFDEVLFPLIGDLGKREVLTDFERDELWSRIRKLK